MAKGDLKHIAATLAILGGMTEPEEKTPARVNKASQDDVCTDMNTPTMVFRITTDGHDLLCSVPWTPELRETIRKRGEMIASVAEVDERVDALSFFWYGLDVRQFDDDLEEEIPELDYRGLTDECEPILVEGEISQAGEEKRIDCMQMHVTDRCVYFTFGVKHYSDTLTGGRIYFTDKKFFPGE